MNQHNVDPILQQRVFNFEKAIKRQLPSNAEPHWINFQDRISNSWQNIINENPNETQKERCGCGSVYIVSGRNSHTKTQKHIKFCFLSDSALGGFRVLCQIQRHIENVQRQHNRNLMEQYIREHQSQQNQSPNEVNTPTHTRYVIRESPVGEQRPRGMACLLYTSDAADE